MSSREPFFEPPPPPEDEGVTARTFANHPWSPPINVVPVVVPVHADVVATPSVVIRVTDIAAYDRGMLVTLEGWVHPDVASVTQGAYGMHEMPRVGLLLEDGTRLGAGDPRHSPDVGPVESGTAERPGFDMSGGSSGDLRSSQSFWVHPIPRGGAEVVVAWEILDVPETYLPLDLDAVREMSAAARELWPLPDVTDMEMGWFAYAPHGGASAYGSTLDLQLDDEHER
ncbi:hypothetical protein [Knoellia subterranea]|uniref:Uncharacterized protein n=1 Tax=Knoellia subterranea KCTC 19937 TaxID=1385521 RepID=A0A0A0JS89_9MICO|nr:hypothetical protein [Knoellia subterranea]KGN39549.1 hypothetical protein N803_00540 [Knoellia subterranea KCTC 19937]